MSALPTKGQPGAVPRGTRRLLGLAAAALVLGGVGVLIWGSDDAVGGVLIRAGLVLGAAWLVAPLIKRPSLASIGLLATGALLLIRPRLVIAVVVGAVVWWLAKRR